MTRKPAGHPERFINRELSWLAFNERVLEEAADRSNPPVERLKFAAIAASNLDEFFMVRVAGLRHAVADGDTAPDLAGMTPAEQLSAISVRAHAMVEALYAVTMGEILPKIAAAGVQIVSWAELAAHQQIALRDRFTREVLPILTPLAIDASRPFPLLASLSLNLALLLEAPPESAERRLAVVQVPAGVPRLVPVDDGTFVLLEEIIAAQLAVLFPGQPIVESAVIRLARDAELELDDEGGRTHLESVERELRRRRRSSVMRLEVSASASPALIALLSANLEIGDEDVYVIPGPLDLRVLNGFVDLHALASLRDPRYEPVDLLADVHEADLFSLLDERPLLLHHPYDSYNPVLALVAQAADDPDVLAIKQTLYRTSAGSPFIASLQRAAERNKQVTVLVELTARFDEERNIQWARALEEAGAHVIYGVRGYKTHAKICLIVRRCVDGVKRYVHLSTGNYNERTARLYTDFGLMTTDPRIAEDATAFFNAVTGYSDPPRLKKLTMAPTVLRRRLLKLIERERQRAQSGQPAEIAAKMNSLIDAEIIEALYAASAAGVTIRLAVRGICALRPGVPGLSPTIEVVSIVDRFLEHSRIYYFFNGGDEEVYLSSADWMTRNLDRRVELMFPVEDPKHRATVMYALRAMFRDNVKARVLGPDGTYRRRLPAPGEPPFRSQVHLQEQARRAASLARESAGVVLQPEAARLGLFFDARVLHRAFAIVMFAAVCGAASAADAQTAPEPGGSSPPLSMFTRAPETRWWMSGQINVIAQGHGAFPSPYDGPHSLLGDPERKVSIVSTLYTGYRLAGGWEAFADIESAGGKGLSDAFGLAGFTDLDVVRNPTLGSAPYLARLMVRKIVALSADETGNAPAPLSLAPKVPARRIEIRAGKLGMADFFDTNAVGSDSHLQFTNWTVDNNGAYDYAADTRGYTYAAIVEYDTPAWSLRVGEALMPKVANGIDLDWNVTLARGDNVELELRPSSAVTLRLLGYANHANMGRYSEAIDAFRQGRDVVPDIEAHRVQGRTKFGWGVNAEVTTIVGVRLFGRTGSNGGDTESFAYTEVNDTVAGGADLSGARWHRAGDRVGIAVVSNGISQQHRDYLALGGLGFLLGDGGLRYGRETIVEDYYTAHLWRGVFASIGSHLIRNPGYNRDRGPVFVPDARLHFEF